jgi:hypothetical protein
LAMGTNAGGLATRSDNARESGGERGRIVLTLPIERAGRVLRAARRAEGRSAVCGCQRRWVGDNVPGRVTGASWCLLGKCSALAAMYRPLLAGVGSAGLLRISGQ